MNNKFVVIYAIHNLGEVARLQRNYEQALVQMEEALVLGRQQGNKWFIARELTFIGEVHQHLGDYQQAAADFKESLLLSRELNNKECIATCFEGYAGLALAQTQPDRAALLWGVAESLREAIGVPPPPGDREEYNHNIALAYDALGEAAFAAWTTGRSMTLAQAFTYALEEPDR